MTDAGHEVALANPRGFCAGVDRAILIVERALEVHGAPVYVLHEIVHNRHVLERLRGLGTVFVKTLDEVPEGAVTVFSAHGVAAAVVETAKARSLQVIDATCPLVTKVLSEAIRYARQGFWLSLMLSSLVFVVLYFGSRAALTAIGIDEGFRDLTADYLRAIVFGAPAGFAYLALRYTTEGVGWTRPVMFVSIGALGVNVTGNWIFMFGYLGAPELGAVGAGVASAITMYFMFFALLIYMWRSPRYHSFDIFTLGRGPQWMVMRQILALGLPIMVSIVAEAGLFSAVSLLMGKLSASIVAAHQIALNYASTMFMIPMI